MFLKLIVTPRKRVNFIYRHHVMLREQLTSGDKQRPIWTTWKNSLSMIYGTSISTRFPNLNSRPSKRYAWVGRLIKTQVTSRPETIWPEVSSMSKSAEKKARQQWDKEKPSYRMRRIHIIPPDEFEEFDAIIRNAKHKKQEVPVEPAMSHVVHVRIPTTNAPTQKVARKRAATQGIQWNAQSIWASHMCTNVMVMQETDGSVTQHRIRSDITRPESKK